MSNAPSTMCKVAVKRQLTNVKNKKLNVQLQWLNDDKDFFYDEVLQRNIYFYADNRVRNSTDYTVPNRVGNLPNRGDNPRSYSSHSLYTFAYRPINRSTSAACRAPPWHF